MRLQGSANPPLALYGLLTGLTILPLGCTRESAPAEAPPAGAAPASAARESEAQRHLEAARQHAAAQQHAKAVDEYTAALQAMRIQAQMGQNDSLDADVLYARGVAYLAMGFPDTAAADFSEVLRVQTDNGLAYAKRGEAYAKLGDLYKAVRDCTNAIRFAPGSADAYRYRGQAYLARAQFDRSVADLEQAASLEPALAGEITPLLTRAYRAWGERLAEDGDVASAEEKLARARELDPSPGTTASVNATPDQEAVELTAAKQVVDQAQEQFEQGVSLLRQQRFDEALAALTAAIEVRPDFAEAYLRRGEALMRLDFPDTAVKDLEQAIHHSGGLTEAYQLLARAFLLLGSPHRAALAATDALHADPTDALSHALRGEAYVDLGKWDRGIVDLEESVRRDGTLAEAVQPVLQRAYRMRDAAQARAAAPPTTAG